MSIGVRSVSDGFQKKDRSVVVRALPVCRVNSMFAIVSEVVEKRRKSLNGSGGDNRCNYSRAIPPHGHIKPFPISALHPIAVQAP